MTNNSASEPSAVSPSSDGKREGDEIRLGVEVGGDLHPGEARRRAQHARIQHAVTDTIALHQIGVVFLPGRLQSDQPVIVVEILKAIVAVFAVAIDQTVAQRACRTECHRLKKAANCLESPSAYFWYEKVIIAVDAYVR